MTKREAKRHALYAAAAALRLDVDTGAEWLAYDDEGHAFTEPEHRKLCAAAHELANELSRRARKMEVTK